MAVTAAQLQVVISASTSAAEAGISRVNSLIQGLARTTASSGRSFNSAFGAFSVAAGNLISAGIQRITSSVIDAGRGAITAYSEFERLQFAMTAISARELVTSGQFNNMSDAMGAASQRAAELYDWSIKLAIPSPYSESNITQMMRLTTAYGMGTDQAQQLTYSIVQMGSALGLNEFQLERVALALAQVQSKGKLTGEETRQLANAGVPIMAILGKALNKTTAELEEMRADGLLPASMVFDALIKQIGQDYPGAIERFGQTTSGMINALGDLRAILLRTFAGPIIEAFKPGLRALVDTLQDPLTRIRVKEWGEAIGRVVTDNLPALLAGLGSLRRGMGEMFEWIRLAVSGFSLWERGAVSLKSVLEALGVPDQLAGPLAEIIDKVAGKFQQISGFIQSNLKPAFDWVTNVGLPALAGALEFVSAHFEEFWAALAGMGAANLVLGVIGSIVGMLFRLVTPLNLIIAAVGLLAAAWTGNWFGIRDTLTTAWGEIQPKLQQLADWFNNTGGPAVSDFAKKISEEMKPALDSIGNWTSNEGVRFSNWWTTNLPLIQQAITNFTIGVKFIWLAFVTGLEEIWNSNNIRGLVAAWGLGLQEAWTGITNALGGVIRTFLQLITMDWQGAMNTMKEGWRSGWDSIATIAVAFFEGIAQFLGTSLTEISATWQGAFDNMSSVVTKVAASITATILTWTTGMQANFTSMGASLVASIASTFASIQATISSVAAAITALIATMIAGVMAQISAWGSMISSTISSAWNGAVSIVSGAVAQIVGFINTLISAINSIPRVIDIVFNMTTNGSPPDTGGGGGGGGWGKATGTFNAYPDMYMVGENGPEYVYLPAGAKVINRTQANGGMAPLGGARTIQVNVNTGPINSDVDIEYLAYRVADEINRRT